MSKKVGRERRSIREKEGGNGEKKCKRKGNREWNEEVVGRRKGGGLTGRKTSGKSAGLLQHFVHLEYPRFCRRL